MATIDLRRFAILAKKADFILGPRLAEIATIPIATDIYRKKQSRKKLNI